MSLLWVCDGCGRTAANTYWGYEGPESPDGWAWGQAHLNDSEGGHWCGAPCYPPVHNREHVPTLAEHERREKDRAFYARLWGPALRAALMPHDLDSDSIKVALYNHDPTSRAADTGYGTVVLGWTGETPHPPIDPE